MANAFAVDAPRGMAARVANASRADSVAHAVSVGCVVGADSVNAAAPMGAARCQMPLSFLGSGELAVIAKVRGRGDLHHHLETLGFVEGATVEVMSKAADDLIVQIKGTRVALSKQVATRILATTAVSTPKPA